MRWETLPYGKTELTAAACAGREGKGMMRFYYCETTRHTPCVFSEQTMMPLWKKTGGDIPRCIRHGSLISNELEAETKTIAKWKLRQPGSESR